MEIERWDLSRLTTGEYAALRRAAGTTDFDVAAWRAYYKVDVPRKDEDERFTALCMSCLWRIEDEVTVLPMEECLRHVCWENMDGKSELRESMARRVEALLETRYSNDGYFQGKLLSLVKIIRSDGRRFKPDFEKLADDLRWWNNENRSVQRKWLRTIYHKIDENDENDGTEEDTNHDA